jgi:hypothetical protein
MEIHKEDEKHLLEEEKEFFKTHEIVEGYVPPQDPLHDIDSKKTVTLLVVWTVILFAGIWVMSQLFHFMVQGELNRKVAESQGPLGEEVKALRAQEEKELKGEDGHLSIEQAMAELLKQNR